MTDAPRPLELALYRDGKPLSATAFYTVHYWTEGSEHAVSLYPLGGGPEYWSVRLRFGAELAPHWRALMVEVLDAIGCPVASARPALLYTLPWAVPTVVAFPHRWDGDSGPYVFAMRIDGGITPDNRYDDRSALAVTAETVTP